MFHENTQNIVKKKKTHCKGFPFKIQFVKQLMSNKVSGFLSLFLKSASNFLTEIFFTK